METLLLLATPPSFRRGRCFLIIGDVKFRNICTERMVIRCVLTEQGLKQKTRET